MIQTYFSLFAQKSSEALGSVSAFIVTIVIIVAWGIGGIFTGFTENYHLLINTLSTLTTSIIVVLIQHSQLRQEKALQKKLDEMIRATDAADNRMIGLERKPPGASEV